MSAKKKSTSRTPSRSHAAKRGSSRSRSVSRGRGAGTVSTSSYKAASVAYDDEGERRFTPEKDRWDGHYEFGGPWGVLGIMLFSHIIIYYFYVCIDKFQGSVIYPGHPLLNGEKMHVVFGRYLAEHASPTWGAFGLLIGFLFSEYIFALVLPGVYVKGLPLPSQNGCRLTYKSNAPCAWYCMLLLAAGLHFSDVFPMNELRRNFGHYLTAATVTADAIAVWCYVCGLKNQIRMSGNIIYDFFMGSALNFRLPGNVDVKLFVECRNSWVLLMMLTLSCAAEQHAQIGYVTGNMWFMVFAHLIYVNAIQKGEECIISTWDLQYEKFGWMLVYWNSCGVPFLYCMQSLYIQTVLKDTTHPWWAMGIMVIVLLGAYYVWDTVNSQKNRFRMMRSGTPMEIIHRKTFPQLPWNVIENPRTLKNGKYELFVDGFYRYGRKIHYTADLVMAFLWGSACGFDSFIPFFYLFFFLSHLIDRVSRDEKRCRKKYGRLWEEYVAMVPYRFLPYVF